MKTPYERHELDKMIYDPDNYKLGILYFNPRDPRAFVPKRKKNVAWGLNYASPWSWVIILAIVLLIYLVSYLK